MLSYQHAYHAGNAADVHKHAALAILLDMLTRKPRPVTYMETHAGRGLYDLSGPEAAKTGEATGGVVRAALPEGPYAQALSAIRARHGEAAYPGSPAIAAELLRQDDRIALMELHPEEHRALKHALGARAEIHNRDGYEGVRALSPPKPRKGLVLVDPSYEIKSEYEEAARFAVALMRRWPEASVMIWYPILATARHGGLLEGLKPLRPEIHEVQFPPTREGGMVGSGLALINPPYGAMSALREGLAGIRGVFS
ncbi:MAG: 23S rRNA (adenine(2030)-N(6))-methyltransferase RlmJ [Pseudomonadota bacterium]